MQLVIHGVGEVYVRRKKGMKRIVLRVSNSGQVAVSAPKFVPRKAIEVFVRGKANWIAAQKLSKRKFLISNGSIVGRTHAVRFEYSSRPRPLSEVTENELIVYIPMNSKLDSVESQDLATKAAIKLLRSMAKSYLPNRLEMLAKQHSFNYSSLRLKKLKSRWGSCTARKAINLNILLMNLPSELIDHVLLHELCHTEHLGHHEEFWQCFEKVQPECKQVRKRLKNFDTTVTSVA